MYARHVAGIALSGPAQVGPILKHTTSDAPVIAARITRDGLSGCVRAATDGPITAWTSLNLTASLNVLLRGKRSESPRNRNAKKIFGMEKSGGAEEIGGAEGIREAGGTEECKETRTPFFIHHWANGQGRAARDSAFFWFLACRRCLVSREALRPYPEIYSG